MTRKNGKRVSQKTTDMNRYFFPNNARTTDQFGATTFRFSIVLLVQGEISLLPSEHVHYRKNSNNEPLQTLNPFECQLINERKIYFYLG